MEQALRIRLKIRHEELLRLINSAAAFKEKMEEGVSHLYEFAEIKIKLTSALSNFEKECIRVSEYFKPEDSSDHEQYLRDQMRAEELLADFQLIDDFNKRSQPVTSTPEVTTKLPKLEMAKFDGDMLKWPEFWAKFEGTVHDKNLKKSDKLAYLFSAVSGTALEALRGIDMTNDNYDIALDTLKRRFGNKDMVIDAHYEALNKLEKATDATARLTLDSINKHLRILNTLGEDTTGNYFRNIVCSKFPEGISYEMNLQMPEERSVRTIMEILERIIQAKERSKEVTPMLLPSTSTTEALHVKTFIHKPGKRRYPEKKGQMGVSKRRKIQCTFCDGDHFDDQCLEFRTLPLRRRRLGSKRLCYKCFRPGHISKTCSSQLTCFYCKGNHNRALCTKQLAPKNVENRKERQLGSSVDNNSPGMNLSSAEGTEISNVFHNNNVSYLQTATAMLKHKGQSVPGRLLLDCGSQRSYITAKVAKELNIMPDKHDQLLIYTFGSKVPQEQTSPSAKITLVTKRGVEKQLRVNIVPHITDKVRISNIAADYEIDISADDDSLGEGIDLLVGNDYYFSFMKNQSLKLKDNLHLVNTDFGWIVSGHLLETRNNIANLSVITYCQCHDSNCSYFAEPDLPLRNIDLQFLWSLESIGIVDSPKATQEEEAVKCFNETVIFNDGRYEVKWPWIEYPPVLPTNFGLAFGRLRSLLKRADEITLKEYKEILEEQLKAGVIELVNPQNTPIHQTTPPVHYLPHHMVRQEGKKGRLVYDASSKVREERSLNECMYRGPSMLEDLTALLLRFRTGKIGITADIEKAFLQVGLQQQDRDVTRFLWVKDTEKELTEDNLLHYRFCRVPFGIISSPFLLNATIRHHLSKTDQKLLKKIANRCYVDNLVTEADSHSEAHQLYVQTKRIFDKISMNIRDWVSNDKRFLHSIPEEYRAKQFKETKVLGLIWNIEDDTLGLKICIDDRSKSTSTTVTKKDVLRTIARVYDPCGFASPWILPAKLLFQEACTLTKKWDSPLPVALQQLWYSIQTDLETARDIKIPRYVGKLTHEEHTSYDLHCFADASKNAYAAVVYLVSRSKDKASSAFLMSKSRITPMEDKDDLKIPRLELLAYLIGSRLLKYVNDNLGMKISNKYLWTDSLIVLAWMKTSKLLPPFVFRRVNEIKQHKDVQKRYVPTQHNPADIATRPEVIKIKSKLWFFGPEFLNKNEKDWPNHQVKDNTFLSAAEALDIVDGPEMSSKGYEEMEDVNREAQILEVFEETDDQELKDMKELQAIFFPEEATGKGTNLSKNLGLFLDDEGVLRCRGRMMNTEWPYDTKHPILLPKDCAFTEALIQKIHEDNYHVGVPHTLSLVRKKYWIPQGRAKIQKVLRKCTQCIKHGGGPYKLPPTPALPAERVRYSAPFTYTGMDYFGPVFVQTSTGIKEKRWICLFTCLAVRAIHLEVVRDLTAEECLMGLRRFIAVRGKPNLIVSDNASQFKLVSEILLSQDIRWKFIPQLAPWHGGVYERLIGLVKNCLKRTLDKHLLQDGQLLTVIKETEAVVNSRPLTYVGTEVEQILRPADFLTLGTCLELTSGQEPYLDGTKVKVDLLKGWKRGQVILNEFEKMFHGQYLPSLGERYRHHLKQPRVTSSRQPCVGDVVQIKGESRNRNNWKVGKISVLVEGQDGMCRVAKIKVGDQEYTRSVGHLYPLEGDIEGPNTTPTSEINEVEETVDRFEVSLQEDSPAMDVDLLEDNVSDPLHSSLRTDEVETQPVAVPPMCDLSVTPEDVDEVIPDLRARREAAIRAREKIAQWTRHLLAVL